MQPMVLKVCGDQNFNFSSINTKYDIFCYIVATRWVAPKAGTLVTNSFNLYTNYDGKRSNIYKDGLYAVQTTTTNIEKLTGYTFVSTDYFI